MKDPQEGLTPEGHITTGARRDRVPRMFEAVISAAIQDVRKAQDERQLDAVSLYIYGSVATGTAISPLSDVDFLTIGIPADATERIALTLSARFRDICRGVEIAGASTADFQGETDEAYGGRIFLKHYCVPLFGDNMAEALPDFPGDIRAARGFNGDIGHHFEKWRAAENGDEPGQLGRRIARKSLLAVAALVSVHDRIWTTDRKSGAHRWGQLNPEWHEMLRKLISWSEGNTVASRDDIAELLSADGAVRAIVDDFRNTIGLWS
jgi:hypothetical protein